MTALHLPDLGVLWTAPVSGPSDITACGANLCVTGTDGVTAFHRDSGSIIWSASELESLQEGLVVRKNRQTVLLDPDTGWVQSELGRALPAGGLIVRVSRDGVLVFDRSTGELQGRLSVVDPLWCAREARYLTCQTNEGTLMIWRLT
ncbi:hypothetical protein QLQ12_44730 [Actinoplanes sp. NEAU-A12]|uniref:Uncharacterized protein n=1 Tax=Actinoplanes sandaracinus TaxID=3045177 RepID=A0ABT6X1A9_9ACTN|nr:hypothetical protein [Actinoplanes sandaracinus]MDI6105709.1 hypothetical protein [Actinoplanes sandaracinus]